MRKLIFWLHLIAGISAGAVILIMSLTGVLLTYEKQLIAWADREYLAERAPAGSSRLPAQTILASIEKASGATPATLTLYSGKAAVSAAAGGSTYFANAYTGEVLGTGSAKVRGFFRHVTEWHRYVALAGDSRPTGKAVTGAANLIFLFIVASGVVIWWPRTWTRPSLRSVTWFKPGLTGRSRNFNWHNVFGFWTAIPLFLVVFSATVISYPWASNLVYRITGTEPPPQTGGAIRQTRNAAAVQTGPMELTGVDAAIAEAERQVSGWKIISLRVPTSADAPLSFTLDRGNGGQPQLRSTLTFDRGTGKVASWDRFEDQNLGRRARSWLRFVHTGEFYGIAGQTAAGIASFAGVMLVWTGFALALKRLGSWLKRRLGNRGLIPMGPSRATLRNEN